MAKSLKIISRDGYSINNGKIANLIQDDLAPNLTESDLRAWKTVKRKPLCKKYKEYKICGFPPPTSGGFGVLQILSILENFDTKFNYKNTVLDEHLFLEASRLTYADRNTYIADPEFFKAPIKELLSEQYLKKGQA